MNPFTVITVMLGMNRFHQKDTDHPFDMSNLDGYNTFWFPQIQEIEKTNSTLFYEALKGAEAARITKSTEKDNYVFLFGRGTIGPSSEEHLFEAMQQCMNYYGKDVNFIMVAKSFGVADTLAALKLFKIYHRKPRVNGLFLIDGFLPPSEKRHISKKVGKERRLVIPKFVKQHYNVVQRNKGTQGRLVVCENNNLIITQSYVNKTAQFYKEYKDNYKRRLDVSHFNMEEIVSVVPCFRLNGDLLILSEAIRRVAIHYYMALQKHSKTSVK